MRTLFLWFLLATSVFASHVIDHAGIIPDDQEQRLDLSLDSSSVWIETWPALPSGNDIKSYGDRRARELTQRGFLIVVTMQPKAWRISMSPIGLVSGASTQPIGDMMATKFKGGHFYDGLLYGSVALGELISTKPLPPEVEKPDLDRAAARDEEKTDYSVIGWVVTFFAAIFAGFILYLVVSAMRANKKSESPFRNDSPVMHKRPYQPAAERGPVGNQGSTRNEPTGPQGISSTNITSSGLSGISSMRPRTRAERAVSDLDTSSMTVTQRTKAERLWRRTTPEQRRQMMDQYRGHSHYDSSGSNDMLWFYLYMVHCNDSFAATYSEPGNASQFDNQTNISPSKPASEDDSHRRRSESSSSSSSDSWSSSSSYDSGGSSGSFDSGSSSCDSGGSSGGFD
jgi:uncharacterized membrane protein YgcG